ncbi:MAG: GNAT family N-acetyltransferase, partial [Proteobacteria bacterium]
MLPSDALAVAMVHTQSWQTAYKGIIDQSVLDALSIEA